MSQRTVLIVDDNPEDVATFRRYLTHDGGGRYRILDVSSGATAREFLQHNTPDCILLDFYLPDMDGLEFLAVLKAENDVTRFPIVMVTGDGSMFVAIQALQQGIQDYLIKSTATRESLTHAVENAIEKHLLQRQLAAQREELERKNAELIAANEALVERAKVLDNIQDALLMTEVAPIEPPGPRILYVNPAFERMTGYTRAEIVGQTPRILQGEKTDRKELDRLRAALERQEAVSVELTNYRKDGTAFEVEVEIVPLPGKTGNTARFASIQRDVTARKQVAAALQQSEAQMAGIIDSAMDAIICIDADLRIVLFNAAAEQMFRCPAARAIGEPIECFIPERFRREHANAIRTFGQTGATSRSMASLTPIFGLRADRQEFPIEATISYTRVAGSGLYTVIIRDITERKQAETALRESEEFSLSVLDSLTEHIAVLDRQGTIVAVNEAWRRFAQENSPPEQAVSSIGMNYLTVCTQSATGPGGEEATAACAGIQAVLDGRQARFSLEYPCHGPNEERWFVMSVTPLRGSQQGAVVNHVNITERKQREQAAQQQGLALMETLKALKLLPDLNGFLERVLATLTQCLHAISTSLWLHDPVQATLSLHVEWEPERSLTGAPLDHPVFAGPHPTPGNPFWAELVRTRQPLLVDLNAAAVHVPHRAWYLAQGYNSLLLVPLLIAEDLIGCISVRGSSPLNFRLAEIELAQVLAQQVTLAIQMTRLAEQGRQAAVLQERNRMAQDIHDTLAQGFTGILVQLEAAAYAPEQEQARVHIEQARELARQSLQEARRSVRAMRPQHLVEQRLPAALDLLIRQSSLVGMVRTTTQIQGIPYPLPPEVEDQLFRIAQEAVTNVIKHSEAAECRVDLSFETGWVRLQIQDDGKGFDLEEGVQGNGFGLLGMYGRAEQLGGRMTIATRPGHGTAVTVTIPMTPVQT